MKNIDLRCCKLPPFCITELSFHLLSSRCLRDVLIDKYEWPVKDAEQFSSFIEPMLDYVPEKRATAAQCLNHEFLLA